MVRNKRPYKDLTGQRFGRLLVVGLVDSPAGSNIATKWKCQCDCGNVVEVQSANLKSGCSRSCGCLQKELAANKHKTHGQTGTRLYVIWQHMLRRCRKESDPAFQWYGARGIAVCDEWSDFQAFHDWSMVSGYAEGLTIDRIDVNGNYCPENCRWLPLRKQQENKRNNVFIEFEGQRKTASQWARIFGCNRSAVYREILIREGRVHGWEKND